MIHYIKNSLITFIIITLLASNIATLLYQPFTSAISSIIIATLGIATVTSLMEIALDAKDINIRKHKITITQKNNQIRFLQERTMKQKAAVKRYAKAVTLRTKKLVKKTSASIPAESIPVIGVAAVVGGTAYEIYIACQNLEDIEILYSEFQVESKPDNSFMSKVCESYDKFL